MLASFVQFRASLMEIGLVDEKVDESHLWNSALTMTDDFRSPMFSCKIELRRQRTGLRLSD